MRTDLVFVGGSRIQRIGPDTMRMADRPDRRGDIELTADQMKTLDSVLAQQETR